jgi:hypothetical protein
MIALCLGEVARCENPAAADFMMLAQNIAEGDATGNSGQDATGNTGEGASTGNSGQGDAAGNPGQGDATGNAQPEEPSPTPAPSGWGWPPQLQIVPPPAAGAGVQTDGTAPKPTLEWRASADSSETNADAEDGLAPRVDLGGPGTPKWKVITYVSEKTTVDDNINISNSNKQSDVYFTIAPGFAIGWGDFRNALIQSSSGFSDEYQETRMPVDEPTTGQYAYLNYTAAATHFLSHDEYDAVDQDASFNVQWSFPKLLLGLNARFQTLSGPEIDLGERTRRTIYTLDIPATYPISDKTSLSFDAGGAIRDYVNNLSSSEVHGQLFLNYQLFPKTNVGAGLVAGIRELESNPNQFYQQAQLRATYEPTDRLSLFANGGLEVDEASGGSTRLNPVFGVGATYNFDPQNSLNLYASEATSSSAVTSGETQTTTAIDIQGRHRLFSTFSVALSVGYQHVDYYNEGLSTLVRTDDYIYVRPSVVYSFAQWSELELAYEYHRDVSTQRSFDFGENIASLQFNFVF